MLSTSFLSGSYFHFIILGGRTSINLKYVGVPLIPDGHCVKPKTDYDPSKITSNMVCAGDLGIGGSDTCRGDSGGPLVIPRNSTDNSAVIYGVTSWGKGCARERAPGVYARVTNYITWIKNNMKGK